MWLSYMASGHIKHCVKALHREWMNIIPRYWVGASLSWRCCNNVILLNRSLKDALGHSLHLETQTRARNLWNLISYLSYPTTAACELNPTHSIVQEDNTVYIAGLTDCPWGWRHKYSSSPKISFSCTHGEFGRLASPQSSHFKSTCLGINVIVRSVLVVPYFGGSFVGGFAPTSYTNRNITFIDMSPKKFHDTS